MKKKHKNNFLILLKLEVPSVKFKTEDTQGINKPYFLSIIFIINDSKNEQKKRTKTIASNHHIH